LPLLLLLPLHLPVLLLLPPTAQIQLLQCRCSAVQQ